LQLFADKYTVSVSALLLATKIEEAPRRVDLLVVNAFAVRAKQADPHATFTIHDPVRLFACCSLVVQWSFSSHSFAICTTPEIG
jgi:hypothetical protein